MYGLMVGGPADGRRVTLVDGIKSVRIPAKGGGFEVYWKVSPDAVAGADGLHIFLYEYAMEESANPIITALRWLSAGYRIGPPTSAAVH